MSSYRSSDHIDAALPPATPNGKADIVGGAVKPEYGGDLLLCPGYKIEPEEMTLDGRKLFYALSDALIEPDLMRLCGMSDVEWESENGRKLYATAEMVMQVGIKWMKGDKFLSNGRDVVLRFVTDHATRFEKKPYYHAGIMYQLTTESFSPACVFIAAQEFCKPFAKRIACAPAEEALINYICYEQQLKHKRFVTCNHEEEPFLLLSAAKSCMSMNDIHGVHDEDAYGFKEQCLQKVCMIMSIL